MTFLSPSLALVAGAIAVPALLILYFLKLRRREVEISSTLLWKKAVQDMQANAPFQRLRSNILLFLQLLVLAAILFALAQPRLKSQDLSGQSHVILIDRSGSMAALDAGEGARKISRLDDAKKQALALVDSLREGGVLSRDEADRAMVIAFDESAAVVQPLTTDKQVLRAAIDAITPSQASTSLAMAIELARANAPKRAVVEADGKVSLMELSDVPLTIHLFSDGRIPDAAGVSLGPAQEPGRIGGNTLVYHPVGSPKAPNVGIVSLRAERGFDDPTLITVFASIANDEPTTRDVDAELIVNGERQGLRTVPLPPATTPEGGASSMPGLGGTIFQIVRGEGASIELALRQVGTGDAPAGDVLALDDHAFAVLPPARRLGVALVSRGNLLLSTLLDGLPVRVSRLSPDDYEAQLKDGRAGDFDVVVLDGYLPKAALTDVGLPPGRFLVLGVVPQTPASGITDKGKGPPGTIIDWSRDHPALRVASLDGIRLAEPRTVALGERSPTKAIAMGEKGPVILDLETADTRAIITAFDPMDSNWPFEASFVVFTASAINDLGDAGARAGASRSLRPGETLSDRVPAGAIGTTIATPSGEKFDLTPAPDGRIVHGPITQTGFYSVQFQGTPGPADLALAGGRAGRLFASNLFDSQESDVRAADQVPLASTVGQPAKDQTGKADRTLWPYLLLVALGVITLEWYIYNRKVQV